MSEHSLVNIFYFLANIFYKRFNNSRKHDPVRWAEYFYAFIRHRYSSLYSVPQCFIEIIFNKYGLSGLCDNCLVVRGRTNSLKWFKVIFKCKDRIYCRNIQILYCRTIPDQTVLCSDVLLFNIKQSLSTIPCDKLFFEIFIEPINNPGNFAFARSIKILPVETQEDIDAIVLEKAVENFMKRKHYCHVKDLLSINLSFYSPFKINKNVYLRVEEVTVPNEDTNISGFMIGEETSVYQSNNVQSFVPSTKYRLLDVSKLSTTTTVVPLGLENHCRVLSQWFRSFFRNSVKELKPVFVLSGASGVGKKVLLEVAAEKLGVHYCRVDSNDLISPTPAQILANFKTAFSRVKKSSPAIVELSNVELLCYESDSNDTHQLITCLSDHVNSLDNCYPSVIVITCLDFASLPERLTALVLAHHHVTLPSESERAGMLIWLANYFSVILSKELLDHLVAETASFVLADLRRLLALADLHRYKDNRLQLEIQDFTSALEGLSKVERANVGEVDWEDVGGVEDIKKAVLSSIETGKLGGLRRTGLLLHGPPGTGKTLLARAVANQVSAAFIPVKGPELLNMYIGQSEANVRQVFSRARDAAPCILFFDELDSLAPSRGNQSSGGVMDRVVSQLLSEMDSLEVKDDVFVLAATNRPDLIDPALLRPGRLDKMIYVGPFKEDESKLKVLRAITRKFHFEDNFDYAKVVRLLPTEITGAQLNAICYEAWMDSARQIIRNGDVKKDSVVVVSLKNFKTALRLTNINF